MRIIKINDSAFTFMLVLIFAILTYIGLINHEMWRDELQAWLISSSSESLASLFNNLRYECHPALWHLILYLISRFTDNAFYMQIFHASVSILNTFIFVKYSTCVWQVEIPSLRKLINPAPQRWPFVLSSF